MVQCTVGRKYTWAHGGIVETLSVANVHNYWVVFKETDTSGGQRRISLARWYIEARMGRLTLVGLPPRPTNGPALEQRAA